MNTEIQAGTRMSATADGGRAAAGSAFGVQFPAGLKVGFWVCIAIAVAAVARRAAVLAVAGELSWLELAFDKLLFLNPLVRFPGFIWLIAAGFLLPKSRRPAEVGSVAAR